MTAATKAKLAGKGIGELTRFSFRAGRLVEKAMISARGAQREAKGAGLMLKQLGSGSKVVFEKASQFRREVTQRKAYKPLIMSGVVGGLVGGAAVYFFDPQNGRRRRSTARDMTAKLVRLRGAAEEDQVVQAPVAEQREQSKPQAVATQRAAGSAGRTGPRG